MFPLFSLGIIERFIYLKHGGKSMKKEITIIQRALITHHLIKSIAFNTLTSYIFTNIL